MTVKFKVPYLLFFLLFVSCGRRGEDSVYLIPKGYEGNLLIIFNHGEGVDTVYDKNARLYLLDTTTGILKTKFSSNYGVKQHRYYYVDRFGNRTALKYVLPSQLKGTDNIVVINAETGNYFDTSKKVERHFELLTVARERNVDSIANLRSNFMWKVVK